MQVRDTDAAGGRGAVEHYAPASAAVLDRLEAAIWQTPDPDLVDLAALVCASTHGLVPVPRPEQSGESPWTSLDPEAWRARDDLSPAQRAAIGFAEQFSVDVSAVDDEQRSSLQRALGRDTGVFAQAVYVVDIVPRVRFALDRLFGESAPVTEVAIPATGTVWDAMSELIRVVPGLVAVDAVTTELVRLRGARQHNCRKCQSLRSRSALVAGADDDLFEAVDHHASSTLPAAQKAALAFTDAFIWTPGRLGDDVVGSIRREYSPAQQVELVLDIARNATNKLAVSMAADGTDTTNGYEVYDVAVDGSVTYGLSYP